LSGDTKKLFIEFYNTETFTVSILSNLLGVKENTLRTWLSRHFSELGKKSETGRVTYSFVDVMNLRVFTELVQNFSLTPDAAKAATMLCGLRHDELMEIAAGADDWDEFIGVGRGGEPNPLYFSFKKINQYDFEFEPLKYEQLLGHIRNNNKDILIIIPVDNLFRSTMNRMAVLAESWNKSFSVKNEKTPMTKDEIEAKYNEKIDL